MRKQSATAKPFADVPVEEDTTILSRKYGSAIGGPARFEKWRWEGIKGQTIVLLLDRVEGMTDDEIVSRLRAEKLIPGESQVTIKRSGKFGSGTMVSSGVIALPILSHRWRVSDPERICAGYLAAQSVESWLDTNSDIRRYS
jgi:hypothetical protein